MFTGIVEEIGTVVAVEDGPQGDGSSAPQERDTRLRILGNAVTDDAGPGDSIAVSGVCLTVVERAEDGSFSADVMPETLRRSSLGALRPGSPVNLERAVRADGRLGGHIVQGHVDGVGILVSRTPGPRWDTLQFSCPAPIARYIVEKGSIAVDGVSLTVSAVTEGGFAVSLIPTTLTRTTLGALAVGGGVNLEVDVIAKYVERLIDARSAS